ncbi:MAG: hypothetical protein GF417_01570 [Candidatus Latescibacteria bacterium]|nr:hypothetical protein [bacterium]MBD3423115.1 hypothetical protein [Candidatus Latescibacterota bacterium]
MKKGFLELLVFTLILLCSSSVLGGQREAVTIIFTSDIDGKVRPYG